MSDHDLLRDLGKSLAYDRPGAERREAVRSALLVRANEGADDAPRSRWWIAGGAFVAGVAAAAAVALVIARGDAPIASASPIAATARIEASTSAQLEHVIASDGGEVVRVHAGQVRVALSRTATVRSGDATVGSGDGATVEVAVRGDHLASVSVASGSATVTVDGQRAVFLSAGQTWTSAVEVADLSPRGSAPDPVGGGIAGTADLGTGTGGLGTTGTAGWGTAAPSTTGVRGEAPGARGQRAKRTTGDTTPAPAVATAPATPTTVEPSRTIDPATATDDTTATTATTAGSTSETAPPDPNAQRKPDTTPESAASPTERHFAAGWALLRANKPAEAAREFGVAAEASSTELAADARYFQATSLVKAGRKTEAERAYVQFLDAAPKSLRRGRAAVALAKLIAERGDAASAKRWYESALGDVDPSVVAAARAGISAL